MKTFEEPIIEVIIFETKDVIAISIDHDNGFFDISDLFK